MKLVLALLGLFTVAACYDDDYGGYYWYDETNDVWCFTDRHGDTECEVPKELPRTDCEPANDGSLICQFKNADGEDCLLVFGATGSVTYDPCGYFAPPAAP